MKEIELKIADEHQGKTVRYMVLKVLKISSGTYSSLKFSGGILLDGKQAYADEKVHSGQRLTVLLPEQGNNGFTLPGHAVDINIAYEDDDYLIVDKQPGLPTMYSPIKGGPTLETGLYHALGYPENYVFRPVNRLDKGTGGLMAVAKHAHSQQLLQKALHTDDFIRTYTALCAGVPAQDEGTINAPIGKTGDGIIRMVKRDGKPAVTDYRVIASNGKASLISIRLHTGRTHQIRVHMAYIGCPVWGDYVYGTADEHFPGCFALHSSGIAFTQPVTGKMIRIISKVPDMWYDYIRIEK